jgi:hypothetical protein
VEVFPGDEFCQLDPAVATREYAAKRKKECFERELKMLGPVHVKNSGVLFGRKSSLLSTFNR